MMTTAHTAAPSTTQAAARFSTRLGAQFAALGLAAFMSLGTLTSLHVMAAHDAAASSLASTPTSVQAPVQKA